MVAPELAAPGKTTAVLVTLHGPASLQPLNVTLRLISDPSESGIERRAAETTTEIRGEYSSFLSGFLSRQVGDFNSFFT